MVNYFITGGNGFIGSNIAKKLISLNNIVTIYDYDVSKNIINDTRVNYIQGNILNISQLNDTIKVIDVDIVIHCAAICGINAIHNDTLMTHEVNCNGTENVLKCCSKNNINNVILFSTSEIYGKYCIGYDELNNIDIIPVNINERSIYQISKLLCETYGYLYSEKYNMNVTVLRPFNVYGPNQIGDGAVKNFIMNSLNNEPIIITGDGSNVRSWCYIDDIVNATVLSCSNFDGFKIFNIGNSENIITIKSLAEKIITLTQSSSIINYTNNLENDVIIRFPNTTNAKFHLNYVAQTSLDDGLIKTINFFKHKIDKTH